MTQKAVMSALSKLLAGSFFKWMKSPRLWLGFVSSLFLAGLFYFHDLRVDEVQVGSTANRFIIAQVDFEHVDRLATKLAKHQAKYQIGSLFKIDERSVLLQLQFLKESIRSLSENLTRELDQFVETILQARFADPKTVKKVEELQWNGPEKFYVYSHYSGGLPEDFWQCLLPSNPSRITTQFAEQLDKITFMLVPDIVLETRLQQRAIAAVSPAKMVFKAGQVLISPGDRIQEFHKDILISMKETMKVKRPLFSFMDGMASLILGGLFAILYGYYLKKSHSNLVYNFPKLLLLSLLVMLGIGAAKAVEVVILQSGIPQLSGLRYAPILAFSVFLIALLIDRIVALLSLLLILVLSALFLAFEPGRFMLINLLSTAYILLATARIHRRRQIFSSILQTYLVMVPALIAFHIYDRNIKTLSLVYDLAGTLFFMIVAGLCVLLLLPLIERIFNVTTNMTLTEYLDPNHELLRRLMLEAPGTYQHSLLVGHLAEYAARAIGASDLFCRVAALYHDLGKLYNPQYFTENQLGGFNIHRLLTPKESAQVIIAHVEEGEKLGRRFNLPESFIDIMKEHHGTTLVYYFYKKEIERVEGNSAKVYEGDFRYKGPRPRTKESAILMICDCVEAASRCLENSSEEELVKLVEKIFQDRLVDGQLDDCMLTFEEVKKIKKAIVKGLVVTHHVRIRYPIQEMTPRILT